MPNGLSKKDLLRFAEVLRRILGQSAGTSDRIERESLDRSDGLDALGDAGSFVEFEDVDLEALDVEEETARAAFEALRRIADGTFGTCTECGGPIARGRLEALPHAALCIACQEAEEEGEEEEEEP